jgi:hypothetical protein
MVGEDVLQPLDFGGKVGEFSKAQIDHSGVRLPVKEHKFAKIAVVGEQDARFSVGDRQHVPVGEARRVVDGNDGHVVPPAPEEGGEAGVGALVEQEPQAPHATAAVASELDERRDRLRRATTASWAKASAAWTSSMVSRG